MPVFTVENAAAMARRSHEPTSLRNAPKPIAPPITQTADSTAGEQEARRARMIARKEEQMDKLDDDIDACSDPKLIHFLTGSRERVFNEWCVLTGTAKPAPRKTSEKPNRPRVMVEPS